MKQLLKIQRWWDYQLTIMLGFVYHVTAAASTTPDLSSWLVTFVFFVVACIGIAGFGHLVNDYFDRESDRISGARNLVADQAAGSLLAQTVAVLVLAWLPWIWLPSDPVILTLLVLEFFLFVMYSMPVVRLKERGVLGPVADSLYSYTVSTSVATLVFAKLADVQLPIWFSLLIAAWSFLLGLRQIIAHQIQDASRDERTGLTTFVTSYGLRKTLILLDWCVLPGEVALFVAVICVLSRQSATTGAGFLVFVLVVIGVHRQRSLECSVNPWKWPRINRLMFLNNELLFRFYTEWFPLLGLIPLVRRDLSYVAAAALHIVLFKNGLKSTIRWGRGKLRELERSA
jgi:4-hydroxybenzoate polyprenyltransferase